MPYLETMTPRYRTPGLALALFLALAMLVVIPLIDYWAADLLAALILLSSTFVATILLVADEETNR